MSASSTPPGWYHDGVAVRWWDGTVWGEYQATPAPPMAGYAYDEIESGKLLATISHLGFVFGGFIVPLVIYLVDGGKNRFVRHHSREALNFQLTFLALFLIPFVGFFIVFGILAARGDGSDAAGAAVVVAFIVVWAIAVVGGLVGFVLGIVGAVRANGREWWRYPISFRFIGRGRESIPPEYLR